MSNYLKCPGCGEPLTDVRGVITQGVTGSISEDGTLLVSPDEGTLVYITCSNCDLDFDLSRIKSWDYTFSSFDYLSKKEY